MINRNEAGRPQYAHFSADPTHRISEWSGFVQALSITAPWAKIEIIAFANIVRYGKDEVQVEWQLVPTQ